MTRICVIQNCIGKYYAKGLCALHYERKKRSKNLEKIRKSRRKSSKKYYKLHPNKKKEYNKSHPEVVFKSNMKQLEKIGKIFDLTSKQYTYALITWSKLIKFRDKKCQICGTIHNLNSHHIFFKKYYPELSLNLNNGTTLCVWCHGELHGYDVY